MTRLISVDHRGALSVDGIVMPGHLTRKEIAVLRSVMQHNHVASKNFLLTAVYGGMDEPEMKIIDVFVTKIRAKLGEHRNAIETVWGRGYCRNPDYAMAPEPADNISIVVDAKLLEDVVYFKGGTAEEVLDQLLRDEVARNWQAA